MLLAKMFENQVNKTPDKLSIVSDKCKYTFKELDIYANKIKHTILDEASSKQISAERISLFFSHDCDMVAAMLGVLKSGNAYVPIDPNYPESRILQILINSETEVVLTDNKNYEKYKEIQRTLDEENNIKTTVINVEQLENSQSLDNKDFQVEPSLTENLGYIIYTSGSTGKPKGVKQTHKNVEYFIRNYIKNLNITEDDRLTLFSSYCHDASVMDIYSALFSGATLYIINLKEIDRLSSLTEILNNNQITIWHSVPTVYRTYIRNSKNDDKVNSIRYIVLGGEEVISYDIQYFKSKFPNGTLYNLYGQTESSYNSGQFIYSSDYQGEMTLGDIVEGTDVFVMDESGYEADVFEIGEIVVVNGGISPGYWKNEEKTSEVFMEDSVERLYFTGDLGKVLTNGKIKFEGRRDNQVKIRGYRVDIGEIESILLSNELIDKAAVVCKTDEYSEKYLVAFLVENNNEDVKEIRRYLSSKLPDYMVPTHIVKLEEIPLTSTGKINRKELMNYDIRKYRMKESHVIIAPRNEVEGKLVVIFKDILNLDFDIGIKEDFFELGGHSLKATSLVSRIHKEFGVEISLTEIFKSPTAEKISELILASEKRIYNRIKPVEKREYYPLSASQKRMYIINQMDKNSTTYNMPSIFKLTGELDESRLEHVFKELISKHESLRTSFTTVEDELVQMVKEESQVQFKMEYEDVSSITIDENEKEKLITDKSKEFVKPFDLEKGCLLRVKLLKTMVAEYVLMVDMHHIISDGTSKTLIIEEFIKLYAGVKLEPLKIQYKDYAVWQNELFESGKIEEQEKYWLERFEGEIPTLNMPTDYKRSAIRNHRGAFKNFIIDEDITAALNEIAKETGSTLYMVLLSAVNVLLEKYTGQEDIVVGSPIAGRHHNDLSNIVGMFVNTLVMRNYPKEDMSFREFLAEVKENSLRAYDNQDIQFEELIERLHIERDMSRNPLFDVMFVLQNIITKNENFALDGLNILPYKRQVDIAKFDITITAMEVNRRISLSINYTTSLYKDDTIERLANHFIRILEVISQDKDVKIQDIDMLSEKEKHQLLVEFNDTQADYPKDKTIHQLFEEQVEKTPDNIAVVYEDESLTYNQLNEKANSLARVLRDKGIKSDDIVGIMVDRSLEMIVGILGILKAGGAYLPIDPEHPNKRIKYMLEDSKTNILLINQKFAGQIEKLKYYGDIIELEDEEIYINKCLNLDAVSSCNSLCYVIYTSGTTGEPKGVLINNKQLVNYVSWFNTKANLRPQDRSILISSFAFDLGYTSIYPSILSGSQLHIVSKELYLLPDDLLNYLYMKEISYIKLTPSHFTTIVNSTFFERNICKNLRLIVLGGEAINIKDVERANEVCKHIEIFNHYGPTEATIGCIAKSIDFTKFTEYRQTPTIGKGINNTQVYILNKSNHLMPIGTWGELCISGDGLARGYLNKPELIDEKFIENPYKPEEKMYKTGDLARWLSNGNIEFLGRIDNQVKIRGYRIELGEIKNKLLKHDKIKEAVVVTKESDNGDKYLCGYLVGDKELAVTQLREYLGKDLPDYMIPPYFVHLDEIPLTKNGKIDTKVLPTPEGKIDTGVEYVASRNEVEEKVVEIFKEVLNIESQVGIKENFFDLGGHSLKATTLASRIRKEFEVEIPLIEIFKSPTVEKISEVIQVLEKSIYNEIKPVEKREYYPMSAAQKRMYIINQMDKESTTYNIPVILKLRGELDRPSLESAFRELVNRHESLSTSFTTVEGKLLQIVKEVSELEFRVEYEDISDMKSNENEKQKLIKDKVKEFVRPFDLEKDTLVRVKLLKHLEDEHLLMVDMHHIVSDGVSRGLVIEEFIKLYTRKELQPLKIQYKDYAVWQNELFKSGKIEEQEKYWLERFEGEIPVLNMLTDYPRPAVRSNKGATKNIIINEEITTALNEIAKETGSTLYMVLLSAVNVLLGKYTGQEDIVIGSPIAGRPHNDLSNIVGMFVNTLAMRNHPKANISFKEFLKEVKENALRAYDNQDIQFEELVEKLTITRDISRNPLFDVMFILQNTGVSDNNLNLEGLEVSAYDLENEVAKFDITITATEINGRISLSINYATSLYRESTIERLAKHFANILEEISENRDINIKDIDILSQKEKHQLLLEFNDTKADYPKDKTIQQLFEEQVERTPNNIALVYEDEKLTYKELNKKANSLARLLRDKGVKSDDIVGIMTDRSLEMIIGILGVLKSSGAYLPVDPKYPVERVKYMLKDADINLMLTQERYQRKMVENYPNIKSINLEDKAIYNGKGSNLEKLNKSSDLAYTIYTSGSTGKPKGVMIEHRSVVNFIKGMNNKIEFDKLRTILSLTTMSFDIFVFETLLPLTKGLKVIIADENEARDSRAINKLITSKDVDLLQATPSRVKLILRDLESAQSLKNIKAIVVGGEVFEQDLLNNLRETSNMLKIYNMYGPTETTIWSTVQDLTNLSQVNIGKPISNTQVYIIDEYGNIQPKGLAGELCIAGDGLARGYLNRPKLTDEKFIDNPFKPEEKMYRTGDLARWLPDGNIEFLGRIDNQVKIRGFRIELGEIENQLQKLPQIKETVVTVAGEEKNEKSLCAYIVVESKQVNLDISFIREELSKALPDYMIPSYFVEIDEVPLTPNGKVNRKALPKLNGNISTGVEYVAPRNKVEEKLVEIFKEVLNIESIIGIKHNFFELGGHSLKANTLVLVIYKELGVKVSLMEVFKSPTIEKLGKVIGKLDISIYNAIISVEEKEFYPMSSVQERLFTAYQLDKNNITYNIPVMVKFDVEFNKANFEKAIKELVKRHDSLRTNCEVIDEQFVQRIKKFEDIEINIEYHLANSEEDIESITKAFVRPFDLEKELPFRCGLIECTNNEHVLMFDTHHIISDGKSSEILTREFSQLYNGNELEELRIKYVDFASWENKMLVNNEWEASKNYWKEVFKDELKEIKLPYDFKLQENNEDYQKREELSWVIKDDLYDSLVSTSGQNNGTLYMIMLAAINMVMRRFANSEDIIIATPNIGRYHPDLERIVGVFINMVPMRNCPKGELKIGEFLTQVIENTQKAMENAKYPYQRILTEVYGNRRSREKSLFKVSFNYMNFLEDEMESIDSNDKGVVYKNETLKNEIDIVALKFTDEVNLKVRYNKNLFTKEKIETFLENIIISLKAIASNLDAKLEDVEFTNLDTKSNKELIEDFNSDLLEGYYKGTIQSRLREIFIKYSNDTAIVRNGQKYTYETLDKKSDIIADLLRSKGVEFGEFVGVHLTDRIEILIMFIGILKARVVFVPLNPDFPNLRLKNMIKETKLSHIITSKELADNLWEEIISEISCEVHVIDEDTYKVEDIKSQWGIYCEKDEIYVCFTSGTTGIPKGMVGINESLKSFVEWEVNHFKFDSNIIVSQVAAYSNDAYYKDILVPLFLGGVISIPPQKVARMSAESIVSWVNSSNINVLQCTPSLFALINNEMLKSSDYKNLKYVLLAGEPLNPESLKTWYKVFGDRIQIINLYGASETTVLKTYYMVQPEDTNKVSIPIGKPIDGARLLLLNDKGNVCNVGELGEIHVRTPFMTKGYFNDKELTDKKFIQNLFMDTKDIVYKSGDKAVQLPDGNYVFKGRSDDQVKIRGNRVELSEISSLLLQHKDIDNCVVIVREENNDKHICAYMTTSNEVEISEIRNYLKERLTDYMIPSYFVKVDEFKLNTNGKIDKKVLPKPQRLSRSEKDYIGPRNKAEKLVEQGWRKVLDIDESISVKENFFEIGGHSIIMLKLADNLKRVFELQELNLIDLYQNPTIEEMAEFITSSEREDKIFYELTKELRPKATIYGVPYVGGDASCYGALAREFDKRNMKIRIMSTSIFDIGSEVDGEKITIEKFAEIRAKEILEQGEENIYLLGHCGGSIIAIAIADELRKLKVKVKGIIVSGFIPTREPNKIIVEATKRMNFRQFVTSIREIGFADRLTVEVVKRYQKSVVELTEYRHRRRRKIKHRIFKHGANVYNIIANRDAVTFNHKLGHRKWRKFAFKVHHIVIEARSHYFISRNADMVTSEIDKIIEMTRTTNNNQKNLTQKDINKEDKIMAKSSN